MSELHLFEGFGVELEYMLVDRQSLEVQPVCDQVLSMLAGGTITNDHEEGPIGWSNELALHVIELKSVEPAVSLQSLEPQFRTAINELDPVLETMDLRLLPTAMHPWMNPVQETELWPHDYHEIYETYDRIFDCRNHGWANVQSVHLNLPFCGGQEFSQLHAAVRLVLPLLPALAASSPVIDGVYSGSLDTRLVHYARHCQAVPSLTGDLIPEPVFDEAGYRREVFERIYQDIRPFDPTGVLQHEFLNARGAIARFDRGSIEIRLMDVQEQAGADLAICAAVIAVMRGLVSERWRTSLQQQQASGAGLRSILESTIAQGEHAVIEEGWFLEHFGIQRPRVTAGELWNELIEQLSQDDAQLRHFANPLSVILNQGTLATRIRRELGDEFSRSRLAAVYGQLAKCLVQGESFQP